MDTCFHKLDISTDESRDLPKEFTYPFCYVPHKLCVRAATIVQEYIVSHTDWAEDFNKGKMLGVLVVQKPSGEVGFLAAYSGTLDSSNRPEYFVPPIYDLLNPDGFFKKEEQHISDINRLIDEWQHSEAYEKAIEQWKTVSEQASTAITSARRQWKTAKAERARLRAEHPTVSEQQEAEWIRESQFQKAELKRFEQYWKREVEEKRSICETYEQRLSELREERHKRSETLQKKIFSQFTILNAYGEQKNLYQIFAEARHELPPAGTGECAAPKLLQYAYVQGWKPLAMAEFWWGQSPRCEVRKQGHYYPACKNKCEPVLRYMMQGLDVEQNPLKTLAAKPKHPEIVYEDEWMLVVDKPADMLSVPGKDDAHSVAAWAVQHYRASEGPYVVHRLDMGTSGLLLVAKTKAVYKHLQAQFEQRLVKKRYVAWLEGNVLQERGYIRLPLCADLTDRPRQQVNFEYGKMAVTYFEVLSRKENSTYVAFYPLTGRTHQLRVHAAHAQGLNAPIRGDRLYGYPDDRLYLHAQRLDFRHPVSGRWIHVTSQVPF